MEKPLANEEADEKSWAGAFGRAAGLSAGIALILLVVLWFTLAGLSAPGQFVLRTFGLLQLAWLVPWGVVAARRKDWGTVVGLVLGGSLAFLLTSWCYALVSDFSPR